MACIHVQLDLLSSCQIESLSSQLIQSSRLVEQLESEKKTLRTRVDSLEKQLSREQEERRSEVTRMDESLQRVSGGIDSALTELENTRSTNLLLQQEVCCFYYWLSLFYTKLLLIQKAENCLGKPAYVHGFC